MGSLAAANAGLAGCGGGGEQPTPLPGNGDGTDSSTTLRTRVPWSWAVGDTNVNTWSPLGNNPARERNVFYDPMVSHSPTENRWVYELADGPPEMRECKQYVTIKDTYTWWDGMTVTAEDYYVLGNIAPFFCCGGPDQVTWEPKLEDEFTYYEQKAAMLNQGFNNSNLMKGFFVKRDIYRPYLERLMDSTTDEEIQAITKELTDLKLTLDDMMEEGFGYGLWKPIDYTEATITFEKHEAHPNAEKTDLENWEWQIINNTQSFYQAFKQDRFDYGTLNYSANIQNPPSGIETIVEYPDQLGRKLGMSWRNEHLSRRPVRRAIAHLLNLSALEQIAGDVTAVSQQTAGMPDNLVADWLGEDFLDSLIDYGLEARPERAAEILRGAGYERRNGVWQDSDGNRMAGLRFISEAGGDEALVGDTISSQLTDFGIKNDFSALEAGSYRTHVTPGTGSGDFDFVLHECGGSAPHPSMIWRYSSARVVDSLSDVISISSPQECGTEAEYEYTAEESPLFRIPVNPAPGIPEEFGDADGDPTEFDPVVAGNRMRYDIPEEEILDLAKQWSWWVNYNAFHVYLHSFDRKMWLDTENFSLREDATIRGTNLGAGPMTKGDIVTNQS
jgi:hypothetical protein